jgi:uncharacterized membrane protein
MDIVFEALITPHRSLSRRGLHIIIGCTCTVSFGVTALFWWLGAWPIAGFNGAEVLLAMVLLRAHAQSARASEFVGLYLSARGRRLEIAAALGEPEKRDLARALGEALHRWRHPTFDNPQLEEG